MKKVKLKVHMIGISGASMSVLAQILVQKGLDVQGSDMVKNPVLERENIPCLIGHSEKNITDDISIVIYSSAISKDNIELVTAKKKKMCLFSRGELLGILSRGYEKVIAVAGSHGKTTTTAMIAKIFAFAFVESTIHFGATQEKLKIGSGEGVFLTEACEYMDNFLNLSPTISVIGNVELDHTDYFKNQTAFEDSFKKFCDNSKFVICNESVKEMLGISTAIIAEVCENKPKGIFQAMNLKEKDGFYSFDFCKRGNLICRINLKVMGIFNVENALFALSVGVFFGASPFEMQKAINSFFGVERRMETIGEFGGKKVICDYAHHPKQIEEIYKIFDKSNKNVVVIFQPHTYSRTKAMNSNFVEALSKFKSVIITETYPAREEYDPEGSGEILATNIPHAIFVAGNKVISHLFEHHQDKTTYLFLGAGDINQIGKNWVKENQEKTRSFIM